jgi:histidyl-tRNA synthetase
MADAPGINDALCEDCRQHYAAVKAYLDEAQVSYAENPRLVRGLDYYTRTVFEVQVDAGLGTQNAIGGGGRYDGLIAEFGGKPTSGLGFAVGLERIALVLEALGVAAAAQARLDVFIACVEAQARPQAFMLCASLRDAGFKADMDHQSRSLKSQFKLADKIGAKWVAVLGPDELERGCCTLRNLATHEERPCALDALGEALALS